MKFKRGNNPRRSMSIGASSGKLYYIVDGDLYIKFPEGTTSDIFQENGVEIHARGDAHLVDNPPESMEKEDVFLEYTKLGFPLKDVIAYSQKSFHKDEIINS